MSFAWRTGPRAARWLEQLDPRLAIAALLVASTCSVLLDTLPGLLALATVCALPLLALRLSWRGALAVLLVLAGTVWSTVLSQALFFPGERLTPIATLLPAGTLGAWQTRALQLSREGAAYGLVQSLRLVGLVALALAIALSASAERLLVALTWYRVPEALAMMTGMAIRFLPQLGSDWQTIRTAAWLRGHRWSLRRGAAYLAVELSLLAPLLASVLRRGARLGDALTLRGFVPTARRTAYPPLRLARHERLALIVLLSVGCVVAGLRAAHWLIVVEWLPKDLAGGLVERWAEWM